MVLRHNKRLLLGFAVMLLCGLSLVTTANGTDVPRSGPSLPKPIVEFLFETVTEGETPNTGSSADDFARAVITENLPKVVAVNRLQTVENAVDFGTKAGNFVVELEGPVKPLADLDSFTITGWLNCRSRNEGSGGNRIVSWINGGGEGVDLVYKSNGALQISVNEWPDVSPAKSTGNRVTANTAADAANWVFFAVTYDSGLTKEHVKFYFGKEAVPAALDKTIDYDKGPVGANIGPALSVGHFNIATRENAVDRMFRGLIDDIRVYEKALTLEQILAVQTL